jgi:hypothetical protein
VPRVVVTDEHRPHKGLNNRAENSHQPTRQRERSMKGFRSVGGAQRFLSAFSGISPHFRPRRHLMTAPEHRAEMTIRFTTWEQHRRHGPTYRGLSPGRHPAPPHLDAQSDTHTPNNVTTPMAQLNRHSDRSPS